MTVDGSVPDPSEPTTVEPPPNRPPLEIVEGGAHWVLEAYNRGRRDGETYSIHDRQMAALRAGKRRMDARGHPCLLRWDSPDSVRTMYWNPDFEHLLVRQGRLTGDWVIVPEAGSVPFYTTDRRELAVQYGRAVQRAYDFKHLHLYTPAGTERRTIDHRFLRHEIDASGVRFDRDALEDAQVTDPAAESEGEPEDVAGPTTPASALAAAVPDLTDIEVVLTEGPLYRYRAGWTDGGTAAIIALSPDRCDDDVVVDAFLEAVEGWSTIADNDYVTTIYDDGVGPSPWIAYDAGIGLLPELIGEIDLQTRLRFADEVAAAYETALLYGVPRRGVAPSNVRIVTSRGQQQATLADWGLSRMVARALDQQWVDPYTAPEQISEDRSDRTAVYHLGALAYYLATCRPPFPDDDTLSERIQRDGPSPPSSMATVPSDLDDILLRALATDPSDRFPHIESFRDALSSVVGP